MSTSITSHRATLLSVDESRWAESGTPVFTWRLSVDGSPFDVSACGHPAWSWFERGLCVPPREATALGLDFGRLLEIIRRLYWMPRGDSLMLTTDDDGR